jgi:Flp pilus assembly secretin CpaC
MTAALLALSLFAVAPDAETVHLRPGAQSVLRVSGFNRVAMGNPDVADVHVTSPGELLLLGRHQGRTTLTLWVGGRPTTRTVIVDDGSGDDLARLIHDLVNPTLKVRNYEDRIVVDGVVDSLEELRRLQQIVGDDARVTLLVRLDSGALRALAENITQAFHRNGLLEARASAVGTRILLEGAVTDEAERQKAQSIADAYYAGFVNGGR